MLFFCLSASPLGCMHVYPPSCVSYSFLSSLLHRCLLLLRASSLLCLLLLFACVSWLLRDCLLLLSVFYACMGVFFCLSVAPVLHKWLLLLVVFFLSSVSSLLHKYLL